MHNYDCVIIPEFGGFVTNYKPAGIDPNLHLFHPPSKAIMFNKNLMTNDGLLANHISRLENLDYDAANGVIHAYVRDAKSSLEAGRRVEIEKVGILYYDQEHNIQFVADGDINYLVEAFGLNSFYAKAIEKPVERPVAETVKPASTPIPVVAPVAEQPVTEPKVLVVETPVVETSAAESSEDKEPALAEAKVDEEKDEPKVIPIAAATDDNEGDDDEKDKKRRPWRYIAAAGIAVLLIGGTYSYKSIATGQRISAQTARLFDLTDWKTPIYRPHNVYETRIDEEVQEVDPRAIYNQPEDVYEIAVAFTDEVDRKVVVRLKERVKPAHVDNTFVDNSSNNQFQGLKYHVIGGCFAEKRNATNFVEKMVSKGYSAHIVDHHKGLYRVAFGSFASRKEAKAKMNHIKAHEQMKSWVLKK